MPTTPSPAHRPARPGHSALPATVWLPGPGQADICVLAPGRVLPGWALEKIRTDFARRPGHPPAPLWRLSITDTGLGMDARTPCHIEHAPGPAAERASGGPVVLLAELHPDALPATPLPPTGGEMPGAVDGGWPGFFHRAHRLLPDGGLLLLATRQRRQAGVLTDPLGWLIAASRTAGFRYLQHIVIAHVRAVDDRLEPAPPPGADHGVVHSDLIALTAIHHP
ncbi:hypothetical protein [Actinacidiphila sp. bgisy167]|uniref:hypothetical protein n=1 Tax=Actinacidiphila sp. bgisy167 TaxID=3413797 RepID=UPI003D74A745